MKRGDKTFPCGNVLAYTGVCHDAPSTSSLPARSKKRFGRSFAPGFSRCEWSCVRSPWIVHLSAQAVRRIAHRYQQGGLKQALYERRGRGSKQLLDASEKQRVIAMVCSD